MTAKRFAAISFPILLTLGLVASAIGQPPQGGSGPPGGLGGPGGPGGQGGPGGPDVDRKLRKQFDENNDGWLNNAERKLAREELANTPEQGLPRGGPGGRRGRQNQEPAKPGPQVKLEDANVVTGKSLYDPTAFRTVFLEFENDDWEKELEAFHGTDVDVPARVTVDGKSYENVGIRFRGQSSFGSVPSGFKRSFNVSFDLADKDQRIDGYKTLNLLNSNGDPSFMSTVLYSQIAKDYIPVPKANHVHVVINGESWGVYVNVQQFDKKFLAENFKSTKGTRWKVDGNPRADGGMRYLGEELEGYKSRFDMKSNDGESAWKALVHLCKTLNETPAEDLEAALDPILDIDGTLKFLALDVALVNSDGYWTRASDYSLFLDDTGKFHVIPHDMNESFALSGRGGPGGPGGPGGGRRRGGRRGAGPPNDQGGPPNGGPPNDQGPPNGGPPNPQGGPPAGGPDRGGDAGERRPEGGLFGFAFGPGGPGGPGGGPGGQGGGPGHGGVDLDPLVSIDNPRMPLRSKLLAVPALRERYLGYIHEIASKSLDWNKVGPFVQQQRDLIAAVVATDTKKLDTVESFERSTASVTESAEKKTDEGNAEKATSPATEGMTLQKFMEQRSKFLLK